MWTTHNIAARTLIWLAVIAVPVQSLQASTCECSNGERCCREEQKVGVCSLSFKAHGHSCCGHGDMTTVTKSCCSKLRNGHDSPCNCGVNCQCGKSRPSKPIAPAVEISASEIAVNDTLSTESIRRPQDARVHCVTSAAGDALADLNVCISLCRFTL